MLSSICTDEDYHHENGRCYNALSIVNVYNKFNSTNLRMDAVLVLMLPKVSEDYWIEALKIQCEPPPLSSSNTDTGPSFMEDPTSGETLMSVRISDEQRKPLLVVQLRTIFKLLSRYGLPPDSETGYSTVILWSQWASDTRIFHEFVMDTSPSIVAIDPRFDFLYIGNYPARISLCQCDFYTSSSITKDISMQTPDLDLDIDETCIDGSIWESQVTTGLPYRYSDFEVVLLAFGTRVLLGQDYLLLLQAASDRHNWMYVVSIHKLLVPRSNVQIACNFLRYNRRGAGSFAS